ncbi:MAG TPA: FAD-linked oxidase C-terminal domain-containing protein, partial [Acidobacteriota bacterium]|nr:FAD-linked oxidase C-terminal domain-containing protein [Acidobacteriota bacterium]
VSLLLVACGGGPPEGAKTMMAGFRSVEECGQSVSTIIAAGILPATIEMMDQKIVRIVENYANSGLPVNAEAVLIVEVDGYLSALDAQMEEIAHILKQHGAFEIRTASTEEERARIWKARKSVGGAISRLAPSYYPADATVPRTELATALSGINRICREADLEVGYALHAGDGNLHPHILIPDPSDPSLLRRVMNAAAKVMKFCVALGGSITGEHGVGIEKRQFMTLMYGPSELQAMQDVKEVFDPVNLLNPGKILPRFTYTPSTPPLQSESGGFGPDIFAPSSPEEVVEAFLAWRQGDKPTVRIIGGQTKSSLMPDAQVRLSSKALTGITRFAPDDLYVTVKAGTKLVELEEAIQERGGMFVPLRSPWPDSTIGGIVSTNFNAPLRCLYGGIRDLMLAVKVVLPDGRVIRVGRPFVKDVAGYDMAKLFTGAYGVLGFLCEISLRLVPAPHYLTSLVVPAPDLHSGLKWGKTIRRLSRLGSALLLCRNGFPGVAPSPCFLVHTLEGRREEVRFEASALKAALSSEGAPAVMEVGNDAGSRQWASFLASPGTGTITLRLGVPVRGLARMLELVEQAGTQIEFLVDLASGLIYAHVPASQATIRRELAETARMEGGYCLAINGPEGSLSRDGIWGYEPESLDLMRRLKMRWDPGNLVNPRTLI